MALTLDPVSEDVCELDEFVEYVERTVDVDDIDTVCAVAVKFRALLNNRTLISRFLARELVNWRDFQRGNAYVSQALVLVQRPQFAIRANMWLPSDHRKPLPGGTFATYEPAHDHNFTLLTGGYHGAGYATSIYEYDRRDVRGIAGERVRIDPLEETTLPRDKVMIYRANRDIHVQRPPQEFSVSLNLLLLGEAAAIPQYFFDLESGTIVNGGSPVVGGTVALCDLAVHVGDDRTTELLGDLAEYGADRATRDVARRALAAVGTK